VFTRETYPEGAEFTIQPLEFVLGVTLEWVALNDAHIARVDGCSTIGRSGLLVTNAGLVDPGFRGTLTLELFNLAPFPLVLRIGDRIGQLVVSRMLGSSTRPYGSPGLGSRYQNQQVATPARPPQPQWPS
jgi:dCTP deaminase